MTSATEGFGEGASTDGAARWEEISREGGRILELIREVHTGASQRRVLRADTDLRGRVDHVRGLPEWGASLHEALSEAEDLIFRGYANFAHPQYFGYISPRPLAVPLLGDLLASGLNQTPGAWRGGPGATVIEAETLAWLADFVGFPRPHGPLPQGIFTGGGTMANACALKLARDTVLGRDVQDVGLAGARRQPTVYMSREGHFSVWKSLDLLGIGRNSLRQIDVDDRGRVVPEAVEESIRADLSQGRHPVCIVGVAGTSATGAVDPLRDLAQIAKKYSIWYHIDGASGSVMAVRPSCADEFQGLDLGDSLTVDPCKWLFLPYGIGCLLVKNGIELARSFGATGHYWEDLGEIDLFQMGPYGTRQWRSLGLWLAFKCLGREGYGALLDRLLGSARYLSERLRREEALELLHDSRLPILAFRVRSDRGRDARNRLNIAIQRTVVDRGTHYISLVDWRGDSYLRVAISNYATEHRHLDDLVNTVLLVASEIAEQATA